ncbi:hypothetical protein OtV6_045c [Ostreococcus tauri virus RT-2011]|jgi:hypothetical protein|nr:hypothetical protein OtV6_045c [Ostreococcus tauri virus RT-2011]
MDTNNVIAAVAFGIGFIQMYQDLKRSEEVDEKSKNAVMLGVLASIMWLIYQSRKYGMNFTVAYTGVGLLIQLYVLNKILVKENKQA